MIGRKLQADQISLLRFHVPLTFQGCCYNQLVDIGSYSVPLANRISLSVNIIERYQIIEFRDAGLVSLQLTRILNNLQFAVNKKKFDIVEIEVNSEGFRIRIFGLIPVQCSYNTLSSILKYSLIIIICMTEFTISHSTYSKCHSFNHKLYNMIHAHIYIYILYRRQISLHFPITSTIILEYHSMSNENLRMKNNSEKSMN